MLPLRRDPVPRRRPAALHLALPLRVLPAGGGRALADLGDATAFRSCADVGWSCLVTG